MYTRIDTYKYWDLIQNLVDKHFGKVSKVLYGAKKSEP